MKGSLLQGTTQTKVVHGALIERDGEQTETGMAVPDTASSGAQEKAVEPSPLHSPSRCTLCAPAHYASLTPSPSESVSRLYCPPKGQGLVSGRNEIEFRNEAKLFPNATREDIPFPHLTCRCKFECRETCQGMFR